MNRAEPLPFLDDWTLAQRCAAGDAAAIRLLTASNNQRLFRAAWSILKDRSEAEDAVQSAYLKAFASVGSFEGRSNISTWLTKITINEALGRLRALKRRRSCLEAQGVVMMEDYRPSAEAPDSALALQELRGIMEVAIASLPVALRTVFVLRDVEGLSVDDTSEALDIPPATVKTRLFRARRQLRLSLAPDVRNALVGSFPFAGADCKRMTLQLVSSMCRSLPIENHVPDLAGL